MKRPPPPEGHASWMDMIVSTEWNGEYSMFAAYARAELAELRKELKDLEEYHQETVWEKNDFEDQRDAARKELVDTKAQLALQAANTVEAMAQRDAAQAERDQAVRERGSFKQHMQLAHFAAAETTQEREKYRHAARQFCGGHIGVSQSKCPACERDSLRAQVAELRGAVLGMGELSLVGEYLEMGELTCGADIRRFNTLVAKLRAEALPGAGEPAAGEGAGQ